MSEPIAPDPRSVFVVHGRNETLSRAMFEFLRSLDLRPMEWTRAVDFTGSAAPYIGQILDAAFARAQAVVVLLTPDEVTYLQPALTHPGDPETQPSTQARPNVLFEAGMALGRSPERTVLVEIGNHRPFSDVAGRHTIRLTNDPASRQALARRLEAAGCPVDLTGTHWHSTGDFTPPPPPGDGLPLGRRIPASINKKPILFDAAWHDRGRNSAGRLAVVNRGSETAYDVKVAVPEGAALQLYGDDIIEKIPGNGKSATILAHAIRHFGPRGKTAFDLTITARTDAGEVISQDVFIDIDGG